MSKKEVLLKHVYPFKTDLSKEELNEWIYKEGWTLDDFIVELLERKVTNEALLLKFFDLEAFKKYIKRWVKETPEGLLIKKSFKKVLNLKI